MIEIKLENTTIGTIDYIASKYRIKLLNLDGSHWCETEQRAKMWAMELLNNKSIIFVGKISYGEPINNIFSQISEEELKSFFQEMEEDKKVIVVKDGKTTIGIIRKGGIVEKYVKITELNLINVQLNLLKEIATRWSIGIQMQPLLNT